MKQKEIIEKLQQGYFIIHAQDKYYLSKDESSFIINIETIESLIKKGIIKDKDGVYLLKELTFEQAIKKALEFNPGES